jgi:hypothetical protein
VQVKATGRALQAINTGCARITLPALAGRVSPYTSDEILFVINLDFGPDNLR